jgi:DNA (cytosine-5)-methyltransferase 1
MKHMGLFEGIGGFSLAARWMGWETLAWCEWNEFGQKVLRHHFPEAEGFGDITKTDFKKYANRIDVITGGFPCQPYSNAGKRKGKADERHLWPEMLRAIREVQPSYVVGENVRGLTNWNGGLVFDEVQADLEAEGYEVLPFLLPACAVNAPHRRDRIWFVAKNTNKDATDANSIRLEQCENRRKVERGQGKMVEKRSKSSNATETNGTIQDATNTNSNGLHKCNSDNEVNAGEGRINALNDFDKVTMHTDFKRLQGGEEFGSVREIGENGNQQPSRYIPPTWENFPTKPPLCGRDDGLPRELDNITFSKWRTESIKAYGNAIVPQIAYEIFKAIEATD